MDDLKKDQPFHQHKHRNFLVTRRASRLSRSGWNKPSYCFQAAHYSEACDFTITEISNAVTDPITGYQMEYEYLIKDPKLRETCTASMSNELGLPARGVRGEIPTGSDTMKLISKDEVPKGKFATYAIIVYEIRPQKSEIRHTQLTVGGNLIKYSHNVSTPTSEISTFKFFLNSVNSTLNLKFCGADIKYFYLNAPIDIKA